MRPIIQILLTSLLGLALTGLAFAENKPEAEKVAKESKAQPKEQHFGQGADLSHLTAIGDVLGKPEAYLGKQITVTGKVVSVCDGKGCWMMLSSGDHRLRIKVKDGEMVFPFNAKDKTAFATGELVAMPMTQEKAIAYLSHMAEDEGKKFDPATVKGDTTIYQLKPVGVTIKR